MITLKNDTNEFSLNHDNDIRERIFNNFILDIAEYLTKKEKIPLRGLSKNFNERIFCHIPINLNLKSKNENEEFHLKNLNLLKILSNFKSIHKISLENLKINEISLNIIEMIITNNKTKIKKIFIGNLFYETTQAIAKFFEILNELDNIKEFSIMNIGNRDRLFIHLEYNKKNFKFSNKIKTLKVYNILSIQIPIIIKTFPKVEEIIIENCSIGDDLTMIQNSINSTYKENQLIAMNLSSIGISSLEAIKAIKEILKKQKNIHKLVLKGLWVKTISELEDEFKSMKCLNILDLSGSKYIFNSNQDFFIFNSLKFLNYLNLSDCRIRDQDVEILLKNLNQESSCSLKEIKLIRNILTNDVIEIIDNYKIKLNSLEILNISFNQKITSKGFNNLLAFIQNNGLKCLKSIDLSNCGINLKSCLVNLANLIFGKPENFQRLEIYFCSLSEMDYINFIKNIYDKSIQIDKNLGNHSINEIRFRLFIKINQASNRNLFKKTEQYTYPLYKNHNLIIR